MDMRDSTENVCTKAEPSGKVVIVVLLSIAVLYFAMAVGTALTKRPWCDEAQTANPALNFMLYGHASGISVFDPPTQYDTVVSRRMPFTYIPKAVWFDLFGFSLFSSRMFSVSWGFLALGAWFAIVNVLSKSRKIALLATALISIDYFFVLVAADGRIDMMPAAIGAAGLACYLVLRERNFASALFAGHSLIALGGLIHPTGILALAGLLFLIFYFDFKRIRLKYILLSLVPYLLGGMLWGLYIVWRPEDFSLQFWQNLFSGKSTGELAGLSFFDFLKSEITLRYVLNASGFRPGVSLLTKFKILMPIIYLIGLIGMVSIRGIRQNKNYMALLILTALYFAVMAGLINNKLHYYLIFINPLYAACLAVLVSWIWQKRLAPRWMVSLFLCGFALFHIGGTLYQIKKDNYQNSFLTATDFLKKTAGKDDITMGISEIAFELGFHGNFMDDHRLGFYTGIKPDIIVMDPIYDKTFRGFKVGGLWEGKEPEVYRYVTNMLNNEFEQIYDNGHYRIYARTSH